MGTPPSALGMWWSCGDQHASTPWLQLCPIGIPGFVQQKAHATQRRGSRGVLVCCTPRCCREQCIAAQTRYLEKYQRNLRRQVSSVPENGHLG